MLRKHILKDVHSRLNYSGLTPDDFTVTSTNRSGGGGATLLIQYRYNPAFDFMASFDSELDDGRKILYRASPGVLNDTESMTLRSIDYILTAISEWAKRIHEELSAQPVWRRVEQQQAQIEGILKELQDLPDEGFTQEETAELRQKLDDLRNLFEENIREHTKSQSETKEKLKTLEGEIELLKHSLDSLSKKGWWSSLKVKVVKWSRDPDNAQLLKSGAEVVKSLLLPPGQPK